MLGPLLLICSNCGQPMRPAPYFSRAANVAKAVFLFIPFSIIGPLLFFLLRKDRRICTICQAILKGDGAVPLQAYSADGRLLAATNVAGGLAVYDPEEDHAALERQSRRFRARAWTWGSIGAGMGAFGAALAAMGNEPASFPLLVGALPLGIGAMLAHLRSQSVGRKAESMRAHEQRARVLELARAASGKLNVSLVATELRIELAEADHLLSSMVDGRRVEMEVDDDGRISYVFTELL
jgi:hypothetical protein